jgi:hypothetical protein
MGLKAACGDVQDRLFADHKVAGPDAPPRCAQHRVGIAHQRPSAAAPAGQLRAASRRFLWLSLVLSAASAPALSQGKLDGQMMTAFGGTYMVSCNDNASPKATVFADALVFLHGEKRIAGRNVQAAASYFGQTPPPDYQTALLSEAPGGQQLMFFIYQDKSGHYLTVDGGPNVVAAIGKPLIGKKFRRCDGGASRPVTAAAAPQRRYEMHELSAAGLLQDPRAKSAYYRALGALAREPWLAALDGPSPQNRKVKVANTDFILASACKNHDCADHNTVLLYAATQNVVYGKVFRRGRSTLIGAPPPAVAAELERLWRSEWQRKR